MSVKIYFPEIVNYTEVDRRFLFPLLKPFFKSNNFSDEERITMYGLSDRDYQLEKDINSADVVILPMAWNYYVKKKNIHLAEKLFYLANEHDMLVFVVMTGDYGFPMPYYKNVKVLRQSGRKDRLPFNHLGIPVFINDPMQKWYQRTDIILRTYETIPTVGFCGQTTGSLLQASKEVFKTGLKHFLHILKLYKPLPQDVQSTSYNRFKILNRMVKAKGIKDNFIFRSKYKAGVSSNVGAKPFIKDFFDNMMASDYILCYRGAGNFSVRFYETLAMGRIPIFINTKGFLPLENEIDWKKHVVWVETNEIDKIVDKVLSFHKKLTPESFSTLQKTNRQLWETKLQLGGYFETLLSSLKT